MESKNTRSHGPFAISNPHIHYSYAIWSCGGFKVKACEVDMESGYSVVVRNHYFLLAGLCLIQEKVDIIAGRLKIVRAPGTIFPTWFVEY